MEKMERVGESVGVRMRKKGRGEKIIGLGRLFLCYLFWGESLVVWKDMR